MDEFLFLLPKKGYLCVLTLCVLKEEAEEEGGGKATSSQGGNDIKTRREQRTNNKSSFVCLLLFLFCISFCISFCICKYKRKGPLVRPGWSDGEDELIRCHILIYVLCVSSHVWTVTRYQNLPFLYG